MYSVHDGSVGDLASLGISLPPGVGGLGNLGRDASRGGSQTFGDEFLNTLREGGEDMALNAASYSMKAIGDLAKGFANIGTQAAVEKLSGKAGTDTPTLAWQQQQQQQALALEQQKLAMQTEAMKQQMALEQQKLAMQAQMAQAQAAAAQQATPGTSAQVYPLTQQIPQETPKAKKGLPTWAWILIGLGGAAAVGGGIYWFVGRDAGETE